MHGQLAKAVQNDSYILSLGAKVTNLDYLAIVVRLRILHACSSYEGKLASYSYSTQLYHAACTYFEMTSPWSAN